MKFYYFMLPLIASAIVSCEEDKDKSSGQDIIEFRDPNFLKALLVVKETDLGNPYNDEVTIPYLINVDANMDGKISINEAKSVKALDIDDEDGFEVREMPEIKYFTSLVSLWCYNERLYSLDVSANKSLRYLDLSCQGKKRSSCKMVTVGNNTELQYLRIDDTMIESFDVSGCANLEYLICTDNYNLKTLDIGKKTALKHIRLRSNSTETLDLSGCINLESLYCVQNIKTLDISKNNKLKYLWLSDNSVETLDLSGCAELEEIVLLCEQIQKIILNVNNKYPSAFIDQYKDIIEYVK